MPTEDSGTGTADGTRPRLWATVLADLRLRLANGDFDERFPTDKELMGRYGVSRQTVREAVRRLDAVDRRPRLGGRIRRPAGSLASLGASLRALGVELTLTPAGRARRRCAPIAAALGADATRPLEVLLHVLGADGQPLLVSELWLAAPTDLAVADLEPLLGLGSDGAAVLQEEAVLPVVASPETRAALTLPEAAAVFCVEGRIDVDGHAVGWHRAFVRPERYRCVVRWDPTAAESDPGAGG